MIIAFSILLTFLLITLHGRFQFGSDYIDSRKVHKIATSRLGGIAVAASFLTAIYTSKELDLFDIYIQLVLVLFFLFVLIEDIKSTLKPSHRLIAIMVCSLVLVLELNLGISNLGVPFLDNFLNNLTISILFTTISLSLLANGFNLIDGFNGLTSGFSIMVLFTLMMLANKVSEPDIYFLSNALMMSTLGFFVLNFPFGKIFLGDSGAYFLGLMTGVLALLLANYSENISYWFVLALFIYPIYELVFSMVRRRFYDKTKTSEADGDHLHHMMYKKFVNCSYFPRKEFCNSATSVLMLLISSSSVIPAYIWADDPLILFSICIIFMAFYTLLFFKLRTAP